MTINKIVLFILIAILNIANTADAENNFKGGRIELNIKNEYIKINGGRKFHDELSWVSIAKVDLNHYIIANYESLILFDILNSKICKVNQINNAKYSQLNNYHASESENTVYYNPTGVASDVENKLVYVANYKGNNILKFKVSVNDCTAELVSQFSSKETTGPENVAINKERNIIVSANYDSGTITAFSLDDESLRWSTNIKQAHGVTILDNRIFATGLYDRKIYELNIDSGKIINSIGSQGWDPMKGQYLWPTSILNDGNLLYLSDAHTGFISVINPDTLNANYYFGGNGPSFSNLLYPYVASVSDNELIVLSSMRNQIVVLHKDSLKFKKGYTSQEKIWFDHDLSNYTFGKGWNGYLNRDLEKFADINNDVLNYGYGNLTSKSSGIVFNLPLPGTLLNFNRYIYFVDGINRQNWGALFSPTSDSLVLISKSEIYPDLIFSLPIPNDTWVVSNHIVLNNGNDLSESVIDYFVKLVRDKADAMYNKNGWIQLNDFEDLIRYNIHAWVTLNGFQDLAKYNLVDFTEKTFNQLFSEVFVSRAGKEFFTRYSNCDYTTCTKDYVIALADEYYRAEGSKAYLSLDEYMFVSMLSGKRISLSRISLNDDSVILSNCGEGYYFSGHGLDAINSKSHSSYLSAISSETSEICFKINPLSCNQVRSDLQIQWINDNEVGREYEIYEIDPIGDKQLILKGVHSNFLFGAEGIYSSDPVNFDLCNKRLMYKMLSSNGQNRLIIKSLRVK